MSSATLGFTTKPSGIPWLGEVPANWEMKKIRFLFRFQSGGTPSTTNEAYWEGALPWVSAKDMKKMWISDTEDHISEHALTESAANTVPANSLLLLTRSGILQHTIPVCVNSRRMAINQDVKGCIPVEDNVDVRFCAYFIHGSQEQLLPLWRQEGATVESLEFETVKNTTFALPSLPEQRAIAAFLDERTARIDGLLARKRRLVQLLKEKRQALIARAVTRGLDAKVKLKESGVPWLGDVPEHWEVKAVKRVFVNLNYRRIPLAAEERADHERNYPYYGASGIIDSVESYLFDEPLILVAEDGANLLSRSSPLAFIARGQYWVNNHAHILRPIGDIEYWEGLLQSFDYSPLITGAAQPKLTAERLMAIPVPVPPLEEQKAIASFLRKENMRTDALVTKVEAAMERLQEYRTALISAAVTGKVRVK